MEGAVQRQRRYLHMFGVSSSLTDLTLNSNTSVTHRTAGSHGICDIFRLFTPNTAALNFSSDPSLFNTSCYAVPLPLPCLITYREMHPSHYRARRLLDISSAVVLPCLLLSILLRTSGCSFTLCFSAALHSLFVLTWVIARRLCRDFLQRRAAARLGAKPIPCVVGKWPGNLDILLRMMKAFDKSYVLDVYLGLFQEYQSTTLNLRIFWIDHVCSVLSLDVAVAS
jgi:hypothetical protein